MNRIVAMLGLAFSAVVPAFGELPPPAAAAAAPSERTAVRVVDGDSLVVELDNRSTTVRRPGFDAPESLTPGRPVEPFARRAASLHREVGKLTPAATVKRADARTDPIGWFA